MPISFNFLPAGSGDAILISADGFNILVDGGNNRMRQRCKLSNELKQIKDKNQFLDWVVLTHIDDDHINGVIHILKPTNELNTIVKNIWFNSCDNYQVNSNSQIEDISMTQLKTFEKLVDITKQKNENIKLHKNISINRFNQPLNINKNIKIELLSPTDDALHELHTKYKRTFGENENISKQITDYEYPINELAEISFNPNGDNSVTNKSSIAFILTYKENFNFLLLADAHITEIVDTLKNKGYSENKKLKLHFVKLSHHGSKYNLNIDFLNLIDTDTFIISSNGNHGHPNKETLSKIIIHYHPKPIKFIFNNKNVFENNRIFSISEKEEYKFELELADKNKLTFE